MSDRINYSQQVNKIANGIDKIAKAAGGPSNGLFTEAQAQQLVDALRALAELPNAISPGGGGVVGGPDATGGHVTSATEAIMGVTAGLVQIARAINDLADAVRESRSKEQ